MTGASPLWVPSVCRRSCKHQHSTACVVQNTKPSPYLVCCIHICPAGHQVVHNLNLLSIDCFRQHRSCGLDNTSCAHECLIQPSFTFTIQTSTYIIAFTLAP